MCAFLTHFPHKSHSFNRSIVYSAVIFQEFVTERTSSYKACQTVLVGKGIVFGGLQKRLSGTAL